ncbi:MAG: A24 family peptidase [Gordonia sp. (in: high G+C Gram-positive bacteria)]|uniref:prepilin peptidase n=1 Tax=Gordonia sp. (in: high G+C Gram-positive bacteria) TaxID=84139 RepID=UPI0039E266B1
MTILVCAWLILLAETDRRTGRLPKTLMAPLLAVAVLVTAGTPSAGLAALAAAVPYLVGYGLRACGGGDVKLAGVCGALVATVPAALVTVLLASVLAAVAGVLTRRRRMPHGPALVTAVVSVAVLAGTWPWRDLLG